MKWEIKEVLVGNGYKVLGRYDSYKEALNETIRMTKEQTSEMLEVFVPHPIHHREVVATVQHGKVRWENEELVKRLSV